MIYKLIEKAKGIVLTLRFSILSIIVTLFVMAMLSLMIITYVRSSDSMSYVSHQLMAQTSDAVFEKVSTEFKRVQSQTQLAADLIQKHIIDVNNTPVLANYIFSILNNEMKGNADVRSIFWGDTKGNFVSSARDTVSNIVSVIIDRAQKPAVQTLVIRDTQGNINKQSLLKSEAVTFEPRVRPWYIDAYNAKKTILTDTYRSTSFTLHYWGVTAATPVITNDGKFIGVFGMDMRLDFLRHYIESIKISEHGVVFIVADDGKLIALPNLVQALNPELKNIHAISNHWLIKSFDVYQKTAEPEFKFVFNNQNYLASYKPIGHFGTHTWLLGIVVPEDDFISTLKKTNYITMVISLFILIFGILLVSKLITRIVKPLKYLVKETQKIKNFELVDSVKIKSRIKEVIHLSDALFAMKKGLRLFQKYVPATLVRQLIEAGEEAHVDGAKKKLVIMFSDIKNFTSIAEHLDPMKLMTQMHEYLDALSKIISEENGTIDKYIGDAIMAFWGAPLPAVAPCHDAAKAALKCQKLLVDLNKDWEAHDMPALVTRVGIHMGDAIVGSLGSSERLNYTAIGDTPNIASRLENVNKIYGTNIIVSAMVCHEIENEFILRMVDYVELKGRNEATYIYELLAERGEQIPFDYDLYVKTFTKGFVEYQHQHWDEAIRHFMACQKIYSADTVAPVFITRCNEFKLNPPDHNWTGAWHLHEK